MESIWCYDTFTGTKVNVEVTEEIAEYIKRSYWREDMQQRRYYSRKVLLNEMFEESAVTVEKDLIRKETIAEIRKAYLQLNEKQQYVAYLRFEEEKTLREIADVLGISTSYVAKQLNSIKKSMSDVLRVYLQ